MGERPTVRETEITPKILSRDVARSLRIFPFNISLRAFFPDSLIKTLYLLKEATRSPATCQVAGPITSLRSPDRRYFRRIDRKSVGPVASSITDPHFIVSPGTLGKHEIYFAHRHSTSIAASLIVCLLTAVGAAILVGLWTRAIVDRVVLVHRHAPPVGDISAGYRAAKARYRGRNNVSTASPSPLQPDWLTALSGFGKLRTSRDLAAGSSWGPRRASLLLRTRLGTHGVPRFLCFLESFGDCDYLIAMATRLNFGPFLDTLWTFSALFCFVHQTTREQVSSSLITGRAMPFSSLLFLVCLNNPKSLLLLESIVRGRVFRQSNDATSVVPRAVSP